MNRRTRQISRVALLLLALIAGANAWQWSWWIQSPLDYVNSKLTAASTVPNALTLEEIRLMRVRDIRRLLSRNHGYSADEVARMIDKADLIQALTHEESKRQQRAQDTIYRTRAIKAGLTAIFGALVIFCWPLLVQGYEILYINFVVWTDRKRFEIQRCRERQSVVALIGVILMLVVDLLQFWLTGSIALSWIIRRSKYFFPVPQLNVQPGQLLGKEAAASSVGGMSINIAPMAISWLMRFVHARLEAWTGRALARALQAQRRAARGNETSDEKAARKAAKRQAREQKEAMRPPPPSSWIEPLANPMAAGTGSSSRPDESAFRPSSTHDEFLRELDEAGGMGELD